MSRIINFVEVSSRSIEIIKKIGSMIKVSIDVVISTK